MMRSAWLWSFVFAFVLFLVYSGRFNPCGIFDFLQPASDDMSEAGSLGNLATGFVE
jgi:hypothetical protein